MNTIDSIGGRTFVFSAKDLLSFDYNCFNFNVGDFFWFVLGIPISNGYYWGSCLFYFCNYHDNNFVVFTNV
jgi:hypothetical protein